MSRELTGKRYNDFTKARQVNFLGHKMRFPQKFHDWLVRDAAATWMEPGAKVDKSAIEAFTFLAYEAVGQIVEMSLLARDELLTSPPKTTGCLRTWWGLTLIIFMCVPLSSLFCNLAKDAEQVGRIVKQPKSMSSILNQVHEQIGHPHPFIL